jgi:hypothetical protein
MKKRSYSLKRIGHVGSRVRQARARDKALQRAALADLKRWKARLELVSAKPLDAKLLDLGEVAEASWQKLDVIATEFLGPDSPAETLNSLKETISEAFAAASEQVESMLSAAEETGLTSV